MASSSTGGASFFDCIVRARACVAFTNGSAGVTVGVLIARCFNLKVSVNLAAPVSITALMT